MDTLDMMLKIALCVALIGMIALHLQTIVRTVRTEKECKKRLEQMWEPNQNPLDRQRMEVKAAQRKDSACLRVVSKRKNEVRAAEQAKRWGEQQ